MHHFQETLHYRRTFVEYVFGPKRIIRGTYIYIYIYIYIYLKHQDKNVINERQSCPTLHHIWFILSCLPWLKFNLNSHKKKDLCKNELFDIKEKFLWFLLQSFIIIWYSSWILEFFDILKRNILFNRINIQLRV